MRGWQSCAWVFIYAPHRTRMTFVSKDVEFSCLYMWYMWKVCPIMSTYSNAHAKVKNWIFDVQFPGNWFAYHFKWFLKLYNLRYSEVIFICSVQKPQKSRNSTLSNFMTHERFKNKPLCKYVVKSFRSTGVHPQCLLDSLPKLSTWNYMKRADFGNRYVHNPKILVTKIKPNVY